MLMGVPICTVILENSLAVCVNTYILIPSDTEILLLGPYPVEMYTYVHQKRH